MYDIVTIGDIKLDTFILIPKASVNCQLKMPECQLCLDYGKKITASDIATQVAGSAPNVAIGLAKMKKSTAVYSQMGKDILHHLAVEFLQAHKVETKYIKAIPGQDSSFAAVLNYKGESTQLVSHNGGHYRIPKRMPCASWVHVSEQGKGYEQLYRDLIDCAQKKKAKISFNPGTVQIEEGKKALYDLIKATTVLFVNKVEALQLIGHKGEAEMHYVMAKLMSLGPKLTVVTDGSKGAYSYDGQQIDFVPAFPGKKVEATGAGDSFATGYLGALMYNQHHSEALRWGAVNASSVVGQIGPTKGLLSHTQIKKRLKDKPNYKTKEL